MTLIKNRKIGRPVRDPAVRIRTLLWYWSVRSNSGLNDGKLDLLFSDDEAEGRKRSYADRKRIFEDIRKHGRSISNGQHHKRAFNLIERVDSYTGLKGSKRIYQSPLWRLIDDKSPSLESTKNILLEIEIFEVLNNKELTLYHPPNKEELEQLSEILGTTEDRVHEILKPEIYSEKRNYYDSIFDTLGSIKYLNGLREATDLGLFSAYLDQLAFSIAIYRYAMFTGNYHALVAAIDFVYANLSYFHLAKINWIDPVLSNEFLELIKTRVLRTSISKGMTPSLRSYVIKKLDIKSGNSLDILLELLELLD